ncbi:hypothetical protein [Neptunicella sp.]|uniref:hypothetical protein n=1 Tax=Neptunicella sp. TaxID=2125986 RepID=UPI003F68BEC4
MNIGENPYTSIKNKYRKSLNRHSIRQYKRLRTSLKRVFTQVKFQDYLALKGYKTIAELLRNISLAERHSYSDPTRIDKFISDSEYRSGYWYKLANGQSITSQAKFFQINDALGFYDVFGYVHYFWNLLNREVRVPNCAFQLPVVMKKRIFKTHHFSNGLTTEAFINNLKQINPIQLETLYDIKSFDSLLALMVMCIAHQYRGGKKVSRKVEKYLYAQFLYLMVFKYNIRLIEELYLYIFFSLESNSLFKTKNIKKSLEIEQLFTDKTFVESLTSSANLINEKVQEKTISQKIMTYLDRQTNHPYFHAYDK